MKCFIYAVLLTLCAITAAQGEPAASTDYQIHAHAIDAAGGASSSADYSQRTVSVGLTSGRITSSSDEAKAGYVGQLYDITGFTIAAAGAFHEGSTHSLSGFHVLDDATRIAIPPTSITWSILYGPLVSISSAGLLTADVVYQNTTASVRGVYFSLTSDLPLTVLDVNPDNFGAYAGDAMSDLWQVQYFGLNNPLASPAADGDGDGQNNAFEYLVGTLPTSNISRFTVQVSPAFPGSNQNVITISPYNYGLNYEIQWSTDLINWDPLETIIEDYPVGPGWEYRDGNSSSTRGFYRVQIEEL